MILFLFFHLRAVFAGQSSKQGAFAEDNLVFCPASRHPVFVFPSVWLHLIAHFVTGGVTKEESSSCGNLQTTCVPWVLGAKHGIVSLFLFRHVPAQSGLPPPVSFFGFFDTKPMWLLPDMGLNVNVNAWGTKSITSSHHKQKQRASVWHFGPCTFCPPKRRTDPRHWDLGLREQGPSTGASCTVFSEEDSCSRCLV